MIILTILIYENLESGVLRARNPETVMSTRKRGLTYGDGGGTGLNLKMCIIVLYSCA